MSTQNLYSHGSFEAACHTAQERSELYACRVYVNARVELAHGVPTIVGCYADDWTDGTTLCAYVNGVRQA